MGIYIKSMKMPERCWDCDLCYDCYYCRPLSVRFYDREDFEPGERRLSDCPLIPVPPHGDLIDRDDLKNKEITIDYDEWDDTFDDGLLFVTDLIDNAPTIIEAEEE